MRIEMVTQLITLACLLFTATFQIRNFIKYKKTNGAQIKRIFLMLITTCFILHTVLLMTGRYYGYFFTAGVLFFLLMYSEWIDEVLKKQWRTHKDNQNPS